MSLFHKMVKWLVVGGTCILPAAYAQTDMSVTIPFGFHIQDKEFPSGEYKVSARSGQALVTLRSPDRRLSHFVLTSSEQTLNSNRKPSIEFQRYGTEYFLSTVWLPWSGAGRVVPRGRRQMELARKYTIPEQTTLVGQLAAKKP